MIIDFILEHIIFFEANANFRRKPRFGTCRDFETFYRFKSMIFSSIYTLR